MDTYIEHLVKRHTDTYLAILKLLIILASITVGAGLFFIFTFAFSMGSIGLLLLVICVWGGWMIMKNFTELEFEYIVTGFTMDVDKIVAQKRRKRMFSIDFHQIDQLARFDEAHKHQVENANVRKRIDASTHVNGETYYMIFNHKDYGRTLLTFSPNEKILNVVKSVKPQALL